MWSAFPPKSKKRAESWKNKILTVSKNLAYELCCILKQKVMKKPGLETLYIYSEVNEQ